MRKILKDFKYSHFLGECYQTFQEDIMPNIHVLKQRIERQVQFRNLILPEC